MTVLADAVRECRYIDLLHVTVALPFASMSTLVTVTLSVFVEYGYITELDALRTSVIPALLMDRHLRDKVRDRARRHCHLAIGADALRYLRGAEIERHHQRQQQSEFDRRNAALIAGQTGPIDDG